jgi:hypothetical protein
MPMTARSILAALAATALLSGTALAKGNPKMAECNKQSAGKTGEERKKFMSECLASARPEKKLTAQQQKMKDCNAQAKAMKGQARKDFMKTCLSAK